MSDSQQPHPPGEVHQRTRLWPYVTSDLRVEVYDYNRAATERLLARPPVDPSLVPEDDRW